MLAQSRAGFLRLAEWLTRAYRTNQHRGRAELKRDWLREGSDGLIALSGARDGDVGSSLPQGNARGAAKAAQRVGGPLPGRYYLEVQRAGRPDDNALVAATVRLAGELALPVVATHPVQFLRREDYRAHEARVCIAGALSSPIRAGRRTFTPEQYFKTQAEMAAAFADLPGGAREFRRHRAALQRDDSAGQEFPARLSHAALRSPSTTTCATKPRPGSSGGSPCYIRIPRRATRSVPTTSRDSTSRPRPSCRWGSPATS